MLKKLIYLLTPLCLLSCSPRKPGSVVSSQDTLIVVPSNSPIPSTIQIFYNYELVQKNY